MATICDLLPKAEKIMLRLPMVIYVLFQVLVLLEQKGGYRLTSGQMGKYQAILLEHPNVTLKTMSSLKSSHTAVFSFERDSSP